MLLRPRGTSYGGLGVTISKTRIGSFAILLAASVIWAAGEEEEKFWLTK